MWHWVILPACEAVKRALDYVAGENTQGNALAALEASQEMVSVAQPEDTGPCQPIEKPPVSFVEVPKGEAQKQGSKALSQQLDSVLANETATMTTNLEESLGSSLEMSQSSLPGSDLALMSVGLLATAAAVAGGLYFMRSKLKLNADTSIEVQKPVELKEALTAQHSDAEPKEEVGAGEDALRKYLREKKVRENIKRKSNIYKSQGTLDEQGVQEKLSEYKVVGNKVTKIPKC